MGGERQTALSLTSGGTGIRTVRQFSSMAAIHSVNSKAEVARHAQALSINISGARGLQEVLKTNLGPKGTLKM